VHSLIFEADYGRKVKYKDEIIQNQLHNVGPEGSAVLSMLKQDDTTPKIFIYLKDVEKNKKLVGYSYLEFFEECGSIGVYLHPDYRGFGSAKSLLNDLKKEMDKYFDKSLSLEADIIAKGILGNIFTDYNLLYCPIAVHKEEQKLDNKDDFISIQMEDKEFTIALYSGHKKHGYVQADKIENTYFANYTCLDEEYRDFGILLFEIAIEISSIHGDGLAVDDILINYDTAKIWTLLNKRENMSPCLAFDKPSELRKRLNKYSFLRMVHSDLPVENTLINKLFKKPDIINKLSRLGKIGYEMG
jgi:hypothetical protein